MSFVLPPIPVTNTKFRPVVEGVLHKISVLLERMESGMSHSDLQSELLTMKQDLKYLQNSTSDCDTDFANMNQLMAFTENYFLKQAEDKIRWGESLFYFSSVFECFFFQPQEAICFIETCLKDQ